MRPEDVQIGMLVRVKNGRMRGRVSYWVAQDVWLISDRRDSDILHYHGDRCYYHAFELEPVNEFTDLVELIEEASGPDI